MTTAAQQIQYLGPKLEVSVAGQRLDDLIVSFGVWTSRFDPGDVAELLVDRHYIDTASIKENDPLTIRWGYKGFDLSPIFNGFVATARPINAPRGRNSADGKRLAIRGVDPMKRLFETKITKTFQGERPTVIIRNLIEPMGIDSSGVAEDDTMLDRLPLYEDNIVHAIRSINRRLRLDHDFWFDVEGVFHWQPFSLPAEPAWSFAFGEDLIEFERRQGGARVTTIGLPARHGERITVRTEEAETLDLWIATAHHYQLRGQGFRTELDLREVPA